MGTDCPYCHSRDDEKAFTNLENEDTIVTMRAEKYNFVCMYVCIYTLMSGAPIG